MNPPVFSSSVPHSFALGREIENVTTNLRNRSIKVPSSPPVCHLPGNVLGQLPSPKQPRNKSLPLDNVCSLPASSSPAVLGLCCHGEQLQEGAELGRAFGLSLGALKKRLRRKGEGGREPEKMQKRKQQQRRETESRERGESRDTD